jgi:hypothetical protein
MTACSDAPTFRMQWNKSGYVIVLFTDGYPLCPRFLEAVE